MYPNLKSEDWIRSIQVITVMEAVQMQKLNEAVLVQSYTNADMLVFRISDAIANYRS